MENVNKKKQFYDPVREPIHTICAYNPPMKFGHVWIYVEKLKKKVWILYEILINIWKMNHRNSFKEDGINHAKDMYIFRLE